jgi:hypothetical protein
MLWLKAAGALKLGAKSELSRAAAVTLAPLLKSLSRRSRALRGIAADHVVKGGEQRHVVFAFFRHSFASQEQGEHEALLAEARSTTEVVSQLPPSSPDTMPRARQDPHPRGCISASPDSKLVLCV